MPQSYVNLIYHIVFSTKDRTPLITGDCQTRLHEYLGGIIREQGGIPLAINGTQDHVHLLVKLRQDQALSEMIREFKASASGWIHRNFHGLRSFAWQNGYGAFTVSTSQIEIVQRYIANQKIHHQTQSFKDEYIELLRLHRVEFDEKFL